MSPAHQVPRPKAPPTFAQLKTLYDYDCYILAGKQHCDDLTRAFLADLFSKLEWALAIRRYSIRVVCGWSRAYCAITVMAANTYLTTDCDRELVENNIVVSLKTMFKRHLPGEFHDCSWVFRSVHCSCKGARPAEERKKKKNKKAKMTKVEFH